MYFIDLQKAYDSVDRTLLWQVLTRIEVEQGLRSVSVSYPTISR